MSNLQGKHLILNRSKFESQRKNQEVSNCRKNCISCPYLLKASLYQFKQVNKTILLKKSFNCENSNLIYVFICQECKDEYIGETGCLVKKQINIYRQHIRQPQYQQLSIEEHLRTCEEGKFHMFPFFKIIQESYEDYFIDKFKLLLNRIT